MYGNSGGRSGGYSGATGSPRRRRGGAANNHDRHDPDARDAHDAGTNDRHANANRGQCGKCVPPFSSPAPQCLGGRPPPSPGLLDVSSESTAPWPDLDVDLEDDLHEGAATPRTHHLDADRPHHSSPASNSCHGRSASAGGSSCHSGLYSPMVTPSYKALMGGVGGMSGSQSPPDVLSTSTGSFSSNYTDACGSFSSDDGAWGAMAGFSDARRRGSSEVGGAGVSDSFFTASSRFPTQSVTEIGAGRGGNGGDCNSSSSSSIASTLTPNFLRRGNSAVSNLTNSFASSIGSHSASSSMRRFKRRTRESSNSGGYNVHKAINLVFAASGAAWLLATIILPETLGVRPFLVSSTLTYHERKHFLSGPSEQAKRHGRDPAQMGRRAAGSASAAASSPRETASMAPGLINGEAVAVDGFAPRVIDVEFPSASGDADPKKRRHRRANSPPTGYGKRLSILNRHHIPTGAAADGDRPSGRMLEQYPADFSDNTQLYGVLDSSDEALAKMEMRPPLDDGDCVPMQEWQTNFYPTCNGLHELDVQDDGREETVLFGTKGYWRDAWRWERGVPSGERADIEAKMEMEGDDGSGSGEIMEKAVFKTLKYGHNFEDDFYEHNRVDAVAMERLTPSPHVMDVYSYCGQSVVTEFADGPRFGTRADKAKGLDKLRLARDLASGLADLHSIDGEDNATFVHFDVNLANFVVSNGTIKVNDFNIGILLRWNTTSNTQCGFPAKYPNAQWRSPEEALERDDLTEKLDVYSMGNILYRLICGHEPWNKLEPGGKPSKEEINEKVQSGVKPFVPDKVRNTTDYATIAIREAMSKCYTFDPSQRPSARSIADELDRALQVGEMSTELKRVLHGRDLSTNLKDALRIAEEAEVASKTAAAAKKDTKEH